MLETFLKLYMGKNILSIGIRTVWCMYRVIKFLTQTLLIYYIMLLELESQHNHQGGDSSCVCLKKINIPNEFFTNPFSREYVVKMKGSNSDSASDSSGSSTQ